MFSETQDDFTTNTVESEQVMPEGASEIGVEIMGSNGLIT